ncbi:MAG: carboxylesterase family protein [Parvibaculum sp.]|uniref:carboxylesterase/lipase family protein n=1 Tax=Parvibaculum sp. TaxID=2024848 RepID=UPI003C737B91
MARSFSLKVLLTVLTFAVPSLANAGQDETRYRWGEAAVVETEGGKVAGFIRNGALEFRGVPFGAPVGGDNRWEMPKPAEPWTGVLPAMNFKAACAQAARYGLTERSDSEDCLHLNVSLPYSGGKFAAKKRPVIVWIHGGAFVGGSSSLYRLDRLAMKADAVVVTMNYRLGVFGFMPHPAFGADRNGGYALEDQRLAMRWVKQNISAFGGDPDNITLAGESAGAASVCMHMIAPEESSGLFNKAIVQSGACVFQLRNVEDRKSFGEAVAKEAGCSDPATALQCLRSKDPEVLIAAGDAASAGDLMAFVPPYGTKTLPLSGLEAIDSGRFVKVPVLNGGTRDELRLYLAYDVQAGRSYTAENYDAVLKASYGEHAAEVKKQYPLSASSSFPAELGSMMTDFRPDIGINHCLYLETARLMSRHVPVYQWEFADRETPVLGVGMPALPDPGFELGAAHSSELNAFFPNFSNTTAISAPDLSPRSEKMAEQMLATWASFIHTGRPAAKGVPAWKPYGEGATAIRFEPGNIRVFDPSSDHKCAFWKSLYPDHFAKN